MRNYFIAAGAAVLGLVPTDVRAQLLAPAEGTDSVVGAVLQTGLFGLGDIDPSSLVVTDDELLSAGQSPMPAMSSLDSVDIVVDDDRVQCPDAQFTSIQGAVAAALPGSTIRVCPGDYRENVIVPKLLTLQAVRHQGEATQCQTPEVPDPTQQAILSYPTPGHVPDIGFDLEADGIVLDGFFIRPLTGQVPTPGLNPETAGIFTSRDHSGYRLLDNVMQDNTKGLYLNSSGAQATLVKHNCFRNNNRPGAASGNGVYSDQGLANASIDDNFFTLDQNAAIVVDTFLTPPANLTITHNNSVDDSSIALFHVKDSVVSYNHSQGSNGSAIFVGGDTSNLEISHNLLENGSANGISIHDDVSGPPIGPNVNLLVTKNNTRGFGSNGIRLQGDAAGNNDNVNFNRSRGNAVDGIRAVGLMPDGETSAGFRIEKNEMSSNGEHDCHGGSATPPANTWLNDKGFTENQPGLCKHAAVTP